MPETVMDLEMLMNSGLPEVLSSELFGADFCVVFGVGAAADSACCSRTTRVSFLKTSDLSPN